MLSFCEHDSYFKILIPYSGQNLAEDYMRNLILGCQDNLKYHWYCTMAVCQIIWQISFLIETLHFCTASVLTSFCLPTHQLKVTTRNKKVCHQRSTKQKYTSLSLNLFYCSLTYFIFIVSCESLQSIMENFSTA